jgi:hypothetical protein
MMIKDLKHQTALRLANEQRDDPPTTIIDEGESHHAPPSYAVPPILNSPPYRSPQPYQQRGGQPYHTTYRYDARYSEPSRPDSRNYTDSQLGVVPSTPLFSTRSNVAYSSGTPRGSNAPLADLGSAENRYEGDFGDGMPPHALGKVNSPLKGQQQRVGSNSSLKQMKKGKRVESTAGRVTPVRDLEVRLLLLLILL